MNQCCIIKELRSMLKKRKGVMVVVKGGYPIQSINLIRVYAGSLLLCELSEFAWTIVMVRFQVVVHVSCLGPISPHQN